METILWFEYFGKDRSVISAMLCVTLDGARWEDWREVEPMLGNLPLQQRRTETLEGEHFSYNFSVAEGSK